MKKKIILKNKEELKSWISKEIDELIVFDLNMTVESIQSIEKEHGLCTGFSIIVGSLTREKPIGKPMSLNEFMNIGKKKKSCN